MTESPPGFLTSAIYQALHTKYRQAEEPDGEDERSANEALARSPSAAELKAVISRLKRAGVGFLATLPKLFRLVRLLWGHLPVDGSVRQIALALRDGLCRCDLLETDIRRRSVTVNRTSTGGLAISLVGGTHREGALFADCLNELLSPIENPRYVITRRGLGLLSSREDYHAIPQLLGLNKERANCLFSVPGSNVSALAG